MNPLMFGGMYVNFSLSGSAVAGVDYVQPLSPAYIGQSGYGVILIQTLSDPRGGSSRQAYNVVVTLEPGAGYALGQPSSAQCGLSLELGSSKGGGMRALRCPGKLSGRRGVAMGSTILLLVVSVFLAQAPLMGNLFARVEWKLQTRWGRSPRLASCDEDALNDRSVVGRPPRRTPAVKSSPLQFSGFSVVPSRDIRAIRGSSVILIFPRNLAPVLRITSVTDRNN